MSNLILYYRTFTVNSKYLNVSKKNFNVEDSIKSNERSNIQTIAKNNKKQFIYLNR